MNNIPNYGSHTTTQQWESHQREDHLLVTLHSLEESSSLYSSIIDEDALELANSVQQTQTKQTALAKQLNNLIVGAKALKALAFVYSENTTLGATGFTISAGVANLVTGNLLLGIPLTAIGINEVIKLIERYLSSSDASGLVGEARTGLAMIQQMEEFQIQSLDSIDSQLGNAMEQLKETEAQLAEIKNLSAQGSADGEAKKQEAVKLTEKAVREQQQAVYTLQNGRAKLELAIKELGAIRPQLENLIKFAQEKKVEPVEIDNFIKEIESILTKIIKAQETILQAANNSDEGLKILRDSVKSYAAALEKYHEAVMVMQTALYEIQKKAQMKELSEAKEDIQKARDEVALVKERAELNKDIAAHADQRLALQQQREQDQFGTASIVMGGGIATAAGFVSPLLILPAWGAGTAAVHYMRRVHNLAARFFAKKTDLRPGEAALGAFKVKYNESSTGWGGYIRDTALWLAKQKMIGSTTAGMIAINLGAESPQIYSFNRNSRSELGIMTEQGIAQLDQDLRALIKAGKLTPQKCLEILDSLAHVPSEHGDLCLITPHCLYLRDLRSECQRA